MPKKRTISRALSERLMTLLAEGHHSAVDLARENDLSLLALAKWAAQPEHVELLSGLVRLSNVRAQIVLSQYRTNAAAKLIEHAMHGETGEISRKACVDLLKIDLPIFRDEADQKPADAQQGKRPSEAAIRRAFRELADRTEAAMRGPDSHSDSDRRGDAEVVEGR
jgi:hypothetical protein